MLPTEDKTQIHKDKRSHIDSIIFSKIQEIDSQKVLVPQHLYFTTDEKTQDGDWYIDEYEGKFFLLQATPHDKYEKIIATTDPSLGFGDKFGGWYPLPQPTQATIKAYCEQGGIDKVDVEYWIVEKEYSITKKREIEIKVDPIHNTITTHRIVEKMYSISDIESYCEKYSNDTELGREIRKLRYKQ